MALSRARLGIAVAINGLALAFLVATLLGDGADLQATASRAYLVVMMVAPMALCVLLALPPLRRDMVLKGAAIVTFATLLAASFDLAREPGSKGQTAETLPRSSQLAHH